jgi:hypothetical protein
MKEDEIVVFRGVESFGLCWSKAVEYSYPYRGNQSVAPAGGLKPEAIACSSVTGSTLRLI